MNDFSPGAKPTVLSRPPGRSSARREVALLVAATIIGAICVLCSAVIILVWMR